MSHRASCSVTGAAASLDLTHASTQWSLPCCAPTAVSWVRSATAPALVGASFAAYAPPCTVVPCTLSAAPGMPSQYA
ncbi:MAG: hypothetical protein IPJ65_23545 [Archangiaceae bacterium]|nr:hypothetical protein [Archangiaceae bacterium]